MRNLVLTGFMGTGKTAVGKAVAQRLNRPFVDMDAVIESRAGKAISRIFATDGEVTFRRMERDLCEELAVQEGLVIATGGGALVDSRNRGTMMATGTIVCLTASADQILDRVGEADDRPLLCVSDPHAEVARLLAEREPAYAAIPWQVPTDGRSVEDLAMTVIDLATSRTLSVTHPSGRYPIYVGHGTLPYLGNALRAAGVAPRTRVAVVSNTVVAPLYGDAVMAGLKQSGYEPFLCALPDGEAYKTLATVRDLYDDLLDHNLDRSGVILALGGGVTGDMAGFAAATFMRGVRFVQMPTTLLSMTDAGVGGKTGVDLPQGKNLVGAFKQPEMVFIDLSVLATLPPEEVRSGMAEVLKHGVIGDTALFSALSGAQTRAAPVASEMVATQDVSDAKPVISPDALARSIRVKIDIVQEDPFEGGRRAVLNLGHTTGHALERLSNFSLRHGEGVAIGIVVAARIAERTGRAETGLVDRIVAGLRAAGLPVAAPSMPCGAMLSCAGFGGPDAIITAMRHDKKRRGKRLRWILPTRIGDVMIADDVDDQLVREVLIELGAEEGEGA